MKLASTLGVTYILLYEALLYVARNAWCKAICGPSDSD